MLHWKKKYVTAEPIGKFVDENMEVISQTSVSPLIPSLPVHLVQLQFIQTFFNEKKKQFNLSVFFFFIIIIIIIH